MMKANISKIIDVLKISGSEIMKIYQNPIDVETKDDESPITKADIISNQIITDFLNSNFNFPIISEEQKNIPFSIRKKWDTFWLLDPLDGTKDYIAKNDQFTINLALVQDRIPIIGFIYAPALDLFYFAKKNEGAYCNNKLVYNHSKRTNLIATDSNFHSTAQMQVFFANHNIKTVKKIGSALKYCKLAEGIIDVYPRLNYTKEWDTAAGHIIAKEAGCNLIDITTNEEIRYNKEILVNNFFIASRKDLKFIL